MRIVLFSAVAGLTVLAACGGRSATTFTATLSDVDQTKAAVLVESIERVIIRKFAALGIEQKDVSVVVIPKNLTNAEVTVRIPNDAVIREALDAILSEKLTFDIRIEKESRLDGEETTDNWIPTSVTGSSLLWAQARGNRETGEISVELQFSETGEAHLHEAFVAARGKNVGIFVRGLLVSKLRVADATLSDKVVIDGIPNERIAEIFADDLNVGLRVTFTPAS